MIKAHGAVALLRGTVRGPHAAPQRVHSTLTGPAWKGCGRLEWRKWERPGRTLDILPLLLLHPGPTSRQRLTGAPSIPVPHHAAAAAALRGSGLRGRERRPAHLHHAAVDAGVRRQLRLLGQRHAGRAAQPRPAGPQRHAGDAAGAARSLGAAAGHGGRLPELLQRHSAGVQQGEAPQLHPEPVLPPGLLPLPQRHGPQLLPRIPQRDSLPHLPRPQRHLGAPLAAQGPAGHLRPAGADEVLRDHAQPTALPQHHLRGHPAGSEPSEREAERPLARSSGAGSDPGGLCSGGHGCGHLLVHGRELLERPRVTPR